MKKSKIPTLPSMETLKETMKPSDGTEKGKKYKFLHYKPTTDVKDVEKELEKDWQEWDVVGISSNENGLMTLLVKYD